METVSTTISHNGNLIKIENNRVYLQGFGTTINNHSMHTSWIEVPVDKLKEDIKNMLKSKCLIT